MSHRFSFSRPVGIAAAIAVLATVVFTTTAPTVASANPAPEPTDVSLSAEGATTSGTVPDGVCRAEAEVIGGGGGANFATSNSYPPNSVDHRGGDGARLTAQYALHPGQPYSASVGGGGGGAGDLGGGIGANGTGGSGQDTDFHEGAGGGGRSDIFLGDLVTPALVAGGGGGSGGGHYGPGMDGGDAGVPTGVGAAAGADGSAGNDGGNVALGGGQGGQIAAPGLGGVSDTSNAYSGLAGSGANGGDGGVGTGIDWGGGGGAGWFGGGGGSSTSANGGNGTNNINGSNIGGAGGGGGASYIAGVAIDGLGTAPTTGASLASAGGPGSSGWGGTGQPADAQGRDGLAAIDFIPCEYNLVVTKTVAPPVLLLGETMTWTVTVTNTGPHHMTRGDLLTLADTLPGSGATNVVSVTHTAGAASGLDQNGVTCNIAAGAAMAGAVTCAQPYSSVAAPNVPAGGERGLDVGGSIEIVYTQVAADLGCAINTASVTDRVDNGSAVAEVCIAEEVDYIEVDKTVSSGPTNNADGTYDLSYDIVVTNPTSSPTCTGTGLAPDFCLLADQTNVQVLDGLDAVIAAAATSVSSAVTAGTCTDPATPYDGTVNLDLLSGTDTITPGTSCTITITLTVTADPDAGTTIAVNTPIDNTASATSAEGASATDTESATFPENPAVDMVKGITAGPVNNADGTYTLTYTMTAMNTGDVYLDNVVIADDMSVTFGTDLVSSTTLSETCTGALLAPSNPIGSGDTCQLVIEVVVRPGADDINVTNYRNDAVVTADAPSNASVTDSDFAEIVFTESPALDLAKGVTAGPVNNADGTYTLSYTMTATNTGDVNMTNVVIDDDMSVTFGTDLVSSTTQSETCTGALLAPSNPIGSGDTCQLVIEVVVRPGADDINVTNYRNDAVVTGDSPTGRQATDSDFAETIFTESPSVELVKAITNGPVNNADGTYSLTYTLTATNTGDVNLSSVAISDDLSATFGTDLVSSSATSDTCAAATLAPSMPVPGAGDTCELVLDVVVRPGADDINLTNYVNDAVVTGDSPSGTQVTDTDNETTMFTESPAVDLVKSIIAGPVNNGDGTYALSYQMVATNTGDVNLGNVVIDDDLSATFGAALTSSTATSSTCPGALLAPSVSPGAGDTCELILDVVITPGTNIDPFTFTNEAVVTGDSPTGAQVTDSDNATTSFSEAPAVGLDKSITAGPVNNGDGTYGLTYTMTATNTGDVNLTNVTITDDLSATFGAAFTSSTTTSDTCPAATLQPSAPAGAGDTCQLVLDVVITPGTDIDPFPFTNDAVVTGDSPGGQQVTDTDDATTSFTENPAIGVEKTVLVQPTSNLDGTFDMAYQIVVENTGDIVLQNVQVTDDLATTFASVVSWTFNSAAPAAGDSCTVNPNFSVGGDTNLLVGADSLAVAETCIITVEVTIEPGMALGPHNNAVDANGTSPGGSYVDDQSDTDVTVVENPALDIVKSVKSGPTNDGTGIYTTVYELTTTNTGDVPLLGVQITDDLETAYAGVASWSETAAVTAGACMINPAFDGLVAGDLNLLVGTDGLAVSASCTVEITVTFDPEGELGTYVNAAGTSGTSPGGAGTNDADSTDSVAVEEPEIALAKAIADPPGIVNNMDGTYDLTYSMTVTNTGSVPLNNVQIADDLTVTFAAAAGFTVAPGAVLVTAGPCDANPSFNGSTDSNLLDGDDRLVVNASCTASFVVTVTPGTTLGVYENNAVAEGESPAGQGVSDASNDGTDADPEGDGPGDNSAPTPVTFPENPEISLTKDIIDPPAVVNNQNGTYTLSYRMVATNTGDVPLLNAQIADDLSVTYATAASWSVVGTSQPNADACTLGTFDGAADSNLLSGIDTMMVGDVCTVDIEMLITPGGDLGPYNNNATASGMSTGGAGVSDVSEDGNDPDPEGDGPGDNSTPTPAWFTEAPQISLNKTIIAGPTNNGDGTYSVTYELGVANSGNIELRNVQVDDDMSITYAPAISWMVDDSRVTQGPCTAATTAPYDGSPAVGLLEGTDTMAVADTCTIEIDVTFEPGGYLGPYDNTAAADGTSPAGDPVRDISQDGDDADPEGDGPGNNSDPTRLSVFENPAIELTKTTAAEPTNNLDGTYTLTWGLAVENTGDIELRNVQVSDDIEATLASAVAWTLDSHEVIWGPCTDSTTFDGVGSAGDIGLLAGTDTMAIGDVCDIEVTVTVTPGTTLGVYTNSADAAGTSPAGTGVTDLDTDDTTFVENPGIDIQKEIVSGPINDGTGIFTSVYELAITNTGDVPLSGLQITDDLATVYAGVLSWTATSQVTAGACTDNPTPFDGDAIQNLLSGTDSLPVIFGCTVEITVVFNPGADLGDYVNTATVEGTSPGGVGIDDADDASGMAEENPQISLTKDIVDGPVNNNDGTYSLTYALVVTNTGDVPLDNVQVEDDLASTFMAATAWMVDSVAVTAGACAAATTVPFDGDAEVRTLEGVDTMYVADSCTIAIDVTVTPGADLGPYNNTATAAGTSPAGEGVDDISQDGADADVDGDGDPSNDSAPTPVWFTEEPQISVTKELVVPPVNNEDGTYTLSYGLVVANTGNVPLANVQVDENLPATFVGAQRFVVTPGSVTITAGECTPNPDFNGALDIGLLAGTNTMAITDTCSLTFEVTVTPGAKLGVYNNSASATGVSPAGEEVTDLSQDGTDADPDGDNDPTNDSDPTPVTFPENPEVSLTKDIVAGPINNMDGTYTLTYGLVVTNTGDVALSGLQVDDDLSATFASAASWVANGVTVVAGDCTAATTVAFDGAVEIGTLEGTDSLLVDESCSIEVDVTVTPGAMLGVYDNTATAGGTSPGGTDVTDISQDGSDADPDGDGDPSNDSDPTPVTFPENPEISLTKDIVAGPENQGDGTYDLSYALVVTNTGDVPLLGVQVEDDLDATFVKAAEWNFVSVSVTEGDCTPSSTYDGAADFGTLAGSDGLAVGDSCTVQVDLEVVPGADLGPYENSATASGTSPGGVDVSDVSQDGAEADPDGDGDPSNDSDPTPAWFTEEPAVALAKALAEGPVSNGDGSYDLTYEMRVANTGNVPVVDLQVNDTLSAAFAGADSFALKDLQVTAGVCTASSTYDGIDDTEFLSGDDVLTTSDTCTIQITVIVAPGANLGPYNNTATVAAASASGDLVTDDSQDGTDEDPDGDNDASNNSEPTPAEFPIDPSIALAKRVLDGPTLKSGSTYAMTYRLVVENTGDTALDNVQVDDNLATTFAAAQSWAIDTVTVSNGDCIASTTFNGDTDTGLLAGTDTLAIGASCTIDVAVSVDVGRQNGEFENTATATGNGPDGNPVSDVSQDGADADPNDNGDSTDNNVPTRVLMQGITPPPPELAFVEPPVPLAVTGADTRRLATLAVALLAFGTTLVFGTRRRPEEAGN